MADATEIKRKLADRAQEVCEYLLPNGKRVRDEWEVGSLGGEAGRSLKVHLRGDKSGVWSDFAGDAGGDNLLELWLNVKGLSFKEAYLDACKWLGIEAPTFETVRKSYNRPKKPQCKVPESAVRTYLCFDRSISKEALSAYKVGERGNVIVYPFLRDGELFMVKEREAVDGAKPKPTEANCEKILFGWQAISDNDKYVTIVEGEGDALSMFTYGHPALSVPFGGGGGNKQDWIENEYPHLERFETIYLCLDMDEQGQKATAEIASRLGRHRCRVVELPAPYKDINECLMDGVPKETIDLCIKNAKTLDPEELVCASSFVNDVVDLFYPKEDAKTGYTLPWNELNERKFKVRSGEVTLWAGEGGSGKSQVVSHCKLHWMMEGAKVCEASFEMSPKQNLRRVVKQAIGSDRPTIEAIHEIHKWFAGKFWLVNKIGKMGATDVLEVFEYARRRYGVDIFIIDSLMRLAGIAKDDFNAQAEAMFEIVSWAVENDVHLHLVAHSRKKGQHEKGHSSHDVRGAGELTDNAFNVIIVTRDRSIELKIQDIEDQMMRGGAVELEEELNKLKKVPGCKLYITKQRNGDWEGSCGLWFDKVNYQYKGYGDPQWFQYVALNQDKMGDF